MKEEIDPLPCPFCGGIPDIYQNNGWLMITCQGDCEVSPSIEQEGYTEEDSADIIERWNRRKP